MILVGIFSSCVLSFFIVIFSHKIRALMRERADTEAVQASHEGDPLRLGGFAIMGSLIVMLGYTALSFPTGMASLILISAIPVLLAGALEDSGRAVSAKMRLLAAGVSSVFAIALLGFWIESIDYAYIDYLLAFPVVAILVTILFTSGFCHAFNLVDGMNGLAALIGMVAAAGLGFIAFSNASPDIGRFAFALFAAIAGFALLNWPFGRLFLGDAGAYGIGHILAWTAITLSVTRPEIAVPALVLVLFWPLADTLHTILRRLLRRKEVFAPDKMHLHQKVRRGLEIIFFGSRKRKLTNPLTTVVLMPLIVAPALTGMWLAQEPTLAWIALLVFFTLFSATHVAAIYISRKLRSPQSAYPKYQGIGAPIAEQY
ncbi:UDP-N-acetylmuramyl pentapeptide phosphotransferase/UDP-N-acetylglucosamine-1-phosphate transferase [Roseinatronobacter thiooxidans]|uniref:UDP-N-acetylmuramyl pentapeptide phosphotransferase/UDP-N-acetylglucosamine-1-phosphate transferase n=2 Tax=Roseinatronobacter thiooxidans TaxID=121821 RepID=A0A2W7QS33_9RHOB|nr:UDP-N-acetylmuramyl pentapeptide phosphotransferase/UDP-N-acetylglucosamine-1-phosphate transferase [Roseinatronobacter thiooxidans]